MAELRDKQGHTLEEFLAVYDVNKYPRPSVTSDIAVFTLLELEGEFELAVLLIKRGGHPHIGSYALPGGFINMDETTLEAANRELCEETGLTGITLRRFGVFDDTDRDPRTRVITVGHYGCVPFDAADAVGGDDAEEASFFVAETRIEAASASAETYRMTLFGKRILSDRARIRYDTMGAYTCAVSGGELASDHGHVLFRALLALNAQPRERMARLLTLGHPEREFEAVQALDRALFELPEDLVL